MKKQICCSIIKYFIMALIFEKKTPFNYKKLEKHCNWFDGLSIYS